MCTFLANRRTIIMLFVLSIVLAGMSVLLTASSSGLFPRSAGAVMPTQTSRNPIRPYLTNPTLDSSLAGGEQSAPSAGKGSPQSIGYDRRTNSITVGIGSGARPTVYLSEGDRVNFYGRYTAASNKWASLERTDSYVQIKDPSAVPAADVCGLADTLVARRYDISKRNEITGPTRKGVSGVFALGPEDFGEGFFETAPEQRCNELPLPLGAPAGHLFAEVAAAFDPTGAQHRLCRLIDTTVTPPITSPYGSHWLLASSWDNEDIDGAVIRINWRDLQKYDSDSTSVVFDWARLDTEFNQAARRGKVILLELLAGDGIPDWVFNDFRQQISVGPPGAGLVVPVTLRDTGSGGTGPGWIRRNGSPTDPHYISLVEELVREVLNHLRNDARFFQALGSLKVTGTNFMTGEMRLQNSCSDLSCPRCWCNTEIWQNALGIDLPPLSGDINNSEATKGGGYTEMGLYAFAQRIENTLFRETQGQKSLIFMLIQAGFPRVRVTGDYWRESAPGGPVDLDGSYSGVIQTVNLLRFGREGLFQTQSGSVPNAAVGKLFIPQHAGLQRLPQDQLDETTSDPFDTKAPCRQQTTPVYSPTSGKFEAPMPISGSDNSGACPNQEAVGESYLGQLTGFQTNNPGAVNTPDDLDSTLWNGTANSQMMFWEAYEQVLWKAAIEKGTGAGALPLSTTSYFSSMGRDYQKNLHDWGNELHGRRSALASASPTELSLADPFPTVHTVKFDKNLGPGETERYYFINPARCAVATGPKYGTIVVTGK